jgi:molybdopterin-guanine dinucleotide biosynthesis protein A
MTAERVVGVLLAGGQARRMGGGDKCLRPLAGRPLLEHVIARARPQVTDLVLNANGSPGRFAGFGLPVAVDVIAGHAGPLAGVLTGMEWTRTMRPHCGWIATFPTDAPFLPNDMVARLAAAIWTQGAEMACARSGGRSHPVAGLWPVRLADALHAAMAEDGVRKVDEWTARYRLAAVDFATDPVDPFFNANRPEDLEKAEEFIAALPD